MSAHIVLDIFLAITAFVAGAIDTVAGGGGLITLPALLLTGLDPVTALGTCKLQAAFAEFTASFQFLRRKELSTTDLKWGIACVFLTSALGTVLLQHMPAKPLKILTPCLLLAVLVYYLIPKSWFKKRDTAFPQKKFFIIFGLMIGFYNGFFGPGTGSVWMVVLYSVLLLPMYQSAMLAKPLNFAGNLSALVWFFLGGKIKIMLALIMAIGSVLGALVGARFVRAHNSHYIQYALRVILVLSVLSTFYDLFFR